MRNVSDNRCRENRNTYFMFDNFPPPENHPVNEIMLKNTVGPDRPQMTTWRMRIACRIPKAINTLKNM
jgi:hypothetical protein